MNSESSDFVPKKIAEAQEDIVSLCQEIIDPEAKYTYEEYNDVFILIAKQAMHVMYLLGLLDAFLQDNAGIHAENTSTRKENLSKQVLFIIKRIIDKEIELGYTYGPRIK